MGWRIALLMGCIAAACAGCSYRIQEDAFTELDFPEEPGVPTGYFLASRELMEETAYRGRAQPVEPAPKEDCDMVVQATAHCFDKQRVRICDRYQWWQLNCGSIQGAAVCGLEPNTEIMSCINPLNGRNAWDSANGDTPR